MQPLMVILTDSWALYCDSSKPFIRFGFETEFILIDIVEIVANSFSFIIVLCGYYIFWTVPIYHRNLMRLIFCMFWPFLTMIGLRAFTFYECWRHGRAVSSAVFFFHCDANMNLIECLRFSVMAAYYIGNANVAIERRLATHLFDRYEYTELFWTMPLNVFIQVTAACITFVLFYHIKINLAYPTFGTWLYGTGTMIVFIYCWKKNMQLYLNFDRMTAYKLTTRYQLSENIRSLRTMMVGAGVCTVMNTFGCFLLIAANATADDRSRRICLNCFNMIIPFYAFSFVVFCLLSNHVYRRKMRRIGRTLLNVICFIRRVEPLPSPKRPLRSLVGLRMEFQQSEEKDIYFSQLRSSWEQHEPQKKKALFKIQ